jgi:hypothetical protein
LQVVDAREIDCKKTGTQNTKIDFICRTVGFIFMHDFENIRSACSYGSIDGFHTERAEKNGGKLRELMSEKRQGE